MPIHAYSQCSTPPPCPYTPCTPVLLPHACTPPVPIPGHPSPTPIPPTVLMPPSIPLCHLASATSSFPPYPQLHGDVDTVELRLPPEDHFTGVLVLRVARTPLQKGHAGGPPRLTFDLRRVGLNCEAENCKQQRQAHGSTTATSDNTSLDTFVHSHLWIGFTRGTLHRNHG